MLGDKIKELRKGMHLTQEQLAKAIGVSRSTIAMVEKNFQGTSRETLVKLAEYFGVSIDYLIRDTTTNFTEISNKDSEFVMLGDKIKNLRKGMHLTQEQLCEKIGIAQSTLGMIESNKREAGKKTLLKIADFFGVTVDYLLSDNETELNAKDKQSITKDLKILMDEFREGTDGTAYYNGQELDDDDLDLIESAMKIALEQIKIKNKNKYTPKKYKK